LANHLVGGGERECGRENIWKSVRQAQSAAVREIGFRSVFVIPTTANQRATLLKAATQSGAIINIVGTFRTTLFPSSQPTDGETVGSLGGAYCNDYASLTILTVGGLAAVDVVVGVHGALAAQWCAQQFVGPVCE
jgi:hypothetical protein